MTSLERSVLALGRLLFLLGLAGTIRRLRKGPRVLLYHAVEPVEGDHLRGLDSNVAPAVFERHLEYLARHHTVVSLEMLESGNLPGNAALVTFDDGYRSVLTEALPRLRAHGMPAVLYVVPGAVGNAEPIWVNELAWLMNRSRPARERAAAMLGCPAGSTTAEVVAAACAAYDPVGTVSVLEAARHAAGNADARGTAASERWYVAWDEARELAGAGVAIGNHTVSHPMLARLSPADQEVEMAAGRQAIMKEVGECTSLAYPFGNHDTGSAAIAVACGHRSVMLVGGGWHGSLAAVGRVPVRGASDAALFAELEVLAPFKAAARRLLGR